MFSRFFFKPRESAPVARDRLKILLAHERAVTGKSDLILILREEILAVIRKHVPIEPDKVRVRADRADKVSMLTVDIEVPIEIPQSAAA